jgi:hypothetical protein
MFSRSRDRNPGYGTELKKREEALLTVNNLRDAGLIRPSSSRAPTGNSAWGKDLDRAIYSSNADKGYIESSFPEKSMYFARFIFLQPLRP